MARMTNRLSARAVATASKPGLMADGGGLYLQVGAGGAKSWLFRFTLKGRARQMGLGSVNTISLSEARDAAEQCRKLLRDGVDPIKAREVERAKAALEVAREKTFRWCAERYIEAHAPSWKNAKHEQQWTNTLEAYVYPVFGATPVQDVDTSLVMEVLEPIWSAKTETASRVRGRIESVLDWASARGYREGANPARWRGHIKNLLPARAKVQKVEHHPALDYDSIGGFMRALRRREGVSARGLEFLILTATRTSEVLGAKWEEVDLDKGVWTIPAERMKADNEHRVPLSAAAQAILEGMVTLKESETAEFVFPGARKGRPFSNMAFLQLLKRMGRGDLTAHGFRSTFRDWAAERTAYPREVAEMALAHTIKDKAEAAYRRGDLFEKRRRLMEDWAAYCGAVPAEATGEKVVPIRTA